MKKFLSVLIVLCLSFSAFVLPVSASDQADPLAYAPTSITVPESTFWTSVSRFFKNVFSIFTGSEKLVVSVKLDDDNNVVLYPENSSAEYETFYFGQNITGTQLTYGAEDVNKYVVVVTSDNFVSKAIELNETDDNVKNVSLRTGAFLSEDEFCFCEFEKDAASENVNYLNSKHVVLKTNNEGIVPELPVPTIENKYEEYVAFNGWVDIKTGKTVNAGDTIDNNIELWPSWSAKEAAFSYRTSYSKEELSTATLKIYENDVYTTDINAFIKTYINNYIADFEYEEGKTSYRTSSEDDYSYKHSVSITENENEGCTAITENITETDGIYTDVIRNFYNVYKVSENEYTTLKEEKQTEKNFKIYGLNSDTIYKFIVMDKHSFKSRQGINNYKKYFNDEIPEYFAVNVSGLKTSLKEIDFLNFVLIDPFN